MLQCRNQHVHASVMKSFCVFLTRKILILCSLDVASFCRSTGIHNRWYATLLAEEKKLNAFTGTAIVQICKLVKRDLLSLHCNLYSYIVYF